MNAHDVRNKLIGFQIVLIFFFNKKLRFKIFFGFSLATLFTHFSQLTQPSYHGRASERLDCLKSLFTIPSRASRYPRLSTWLNLDFFFPFKFSDILFFFEFSPNLWECRIHSYQFDSIQSPSSPILKFLLTPGLSRF